MLRREGVRTAAGAGPDDDDDAAAVWRGSDMTTVDFGTAVVVVEEVGVVVTDWRLLLLFASLWRLLGEADTDVAATASAGGGDDDDGDGE